MARWGGGARAVRRGRIVGSVTASLEWTPITDLPDDWDDLASDEFRTLEKIWQETRGDLDQAALDRFNEKLSRQLAVETGLIERLYSLDRGTTQLLIEHGIDAALIAHGSTNRDPELVAAIIRDQHEAVEGLFAFVSAQRSLTTGYIKELHAALTRHQRTTEARNPAGQLVEVPLLRGDWKDRPNNPQRPNGATHVYCPPEHVSAEMDRLVELHAEHEADGVPPEVEAAWLHHRFTQIHPFQDGNGRVARCLATLIFLRAGWFPLVILDDERKSYIDALEAADAGKLGPLVETFARRERQAFLNALTIADEAKRAQQVDRVIAATKRDLSQRREKRRREWRKAKKTSASLEIFARSRLEEIAEELRKELRPMLRFRTFVDDEAPRGPKSAWFWPRVVETANALDYFANPAVYQAWVRLAIDTGRERSEILVSFHGLGRSYRGLLAVSATFIRSTRGDRQRRKALVDVHALTDDVFQINYVEHPTLAQDRFGRWLDGALATGLELWRHSLSHDR